MINNDAHNQWEDEYNNAKRLFDKFDKILGIVYDQLKKGESEREQFLKRSDEWKDKPLEEVFIDDLVFDEKGKPIENLFASLKGIHDTIKQEDIDKLPEEQRRIAQKRFKELHELVDRGQRMIASGYTKEYTDKILRLTYDMSKDGLREVASKIDISNIAQLFPSESVKVPEYYKVDQYDLVSQLGWFNSDNGIVEQLDGKEFRSFTEYLSSKMTPEAFNTVEKANDMQGRSSYHTEPCYRKYAVLKSMGYDFDNYQDWNNAKKNITTAGFFIDDPSDKMHSAFDALKKSPQDINNYMEGQAVFDAAIQIILENMTGTGIDKDSYTMILMRTEDKGIVPSIKGENINGQKNIDGNTYFPGVCESHGHITASLVGSKKKVLTAVRVPFNRIHALWFMERGEITTSGDYVKKLGANTFIDKGNFQFWAYHQNEIDACTQGLPIIKVNGNVLTMKDTYRKAKDELLAWEGKQ